MQMCFVKAHYKCVFACGRVGWKEVRTECSEWKNLRRFAGNCPNGDIPLVPTRESRACDGCVDELIARVDAGTIPSRVDGDWVCGECGGVFWKLYPVPPPPPSPPPRKYYLRFIIREEGSVLFSSTTRKASTFEMSHTDMHTQNPLHFFQLAT